jgi:SAM-dependent methyltransferase
MMSEKQFSEACERNKEPILAVLHKVFSDTNSVLEIGSGTGQHAVFFAEHLPHLVWQTSDMLHNHPSILAWQLEKNLPNVLPPIELDVKGVWPARSFDAVFTANTCHIMAWDEVKAMFKGIGGLLKYGGLLCIYGPFNYGGEYTSASNAHFDAYLKRQAPHMGIRDQEEVNGLGIERGLELLEEHVMPANNRLLVWRKN